MEAVKRYAAMKDSGVEWIGEIPDSWKKIRLKYLFSIKKDIAGDLGYTVLSVTQRGVLPKKMDDKGQFSLDYSKYQKVHVGEYVMNHMDLLTGWIDISQYSGVTSPDYRVFYQINCDIDPVFYKYLFQFCYSGRVFYGLGQGVAGFGRWRLPSDMFLNFQLPVPSLNEQQAIAAYLDAKCSALDDIISSARTSIDDYKQLKASTIYEAVTTGLNPDVEMKDSGVEWIGTVPTQWSLASVKYLCSMQAGRNLTAEQISDSGLYPVYGGNGLRGYFEDYNSNGNYLLIGRQGALCGNVHRVSGKFWATEHAVITKNYSCEDVNYLYYLLISMDLNRYSSASAAQPGLSVGTISNIKTPFPKIDEQQAIAAYLDTRCAEIDSLIVEKEALIADLEAYKKSLIYECVTGKRRVA